MFKNKKAYTLISFGVLNILHAFLHLMQVLQSILLISASTHNHNHEHEQSTIEWLLHHPIMAFIWAIVGVSTLIMGIKDFKHHKNCK